MVVAMVTTTTVEAVLLRLLVRPQNADCPALAFAGPAHESERLLMIATSAISMAMTTIDVSATKRMIWRRRTEPDHHYHHRRHQQGGDLLRTDVSERYLLLLLLSATSSPSPAVHTTTDFVSVDRRGLGECVQQLDDGMQSSASPVSTTASSRSGSGTGPKASHYRLASFESVVRRGPVWPKDHESQ